MNNLTLVCAKLHGFYVMPVCKVQITPICVTEKHGRIGHLLLPILFPLPAFFHSCCVSVAHVMFLLILSAVNVSSSDHFFHSF